MRLWRVYRPNAYIYYLWDTTPHLFSIHAAIPEILEESDVRVFGQITELVCGEDGFAMLDEIKVFGENEGGLQVDYGYALRSSGYAMWG